LSTDLDELRECCKNPKKYYIIYDGGNTPDLPVLICQTCFGTKSIFQKFIKHKELVSDNNIFQKISKSQEDLKN